MMKWLIGVFVMGALSGCESSPTEPPTSATFALVSIMGQPLPDVAEPQTLWQYTLLDRTLMLTPDGRYVVLEHAIKRMTRADGTPVDSAIAHTSAGAYVWQKSMLVLTTPSGLTSSTFWLDGENLMGDELPFDGPCACVGRDFIYRRTSRD